MTKLECQKTKLSSILSFYIEHLSLIHHSSLIILNYVNRSSPVSSQDSYSFSCAEVRLRIRYDECAESSRSVEFV